MAIRLQRHAWGFICAQPIGSAFVWLTEPCHRCSMECSLGNTLANPEQEVSPDMPSSTSGVTCFHAIPQLNRETVGCVCFNQREDVKDQFVDILFGTNNCDTLWRRAQLRPAQDCWTRPCNSSVVLSLGAT